MFLLSHFFFPPFEGSRIYLCEYISIYFNPRKQPRKKKNETLRITLKARRTALKLYYSVVNDASRVLSKNSKPTHDDTQLTRSTATCLTIDVYKYSRRVAKIHRARIRLFIGFIQLAKGSYACRRRRTPWTKVSRVFLSFSLL